MSERVPPIHHTSFTAPPVPPTAAVMTYLSLHITDRPEWDEPPEVGVLDSAITGSVSSYPLPIPTATWDTYAEPVRLLTKLTRLLYEEGRQDHALLRRIERAALTDMIGIYFRYEGWAPAKGEEETAARLLRAGASYRFAHAANRRELRSVLAVLVNGEMLQCAVYRDEPHRLLTKAVSGGLSSKGQLMNSLYLEGMPHILTGLMYGLLGTMRLDQEGTG